MRSSRGRRRAALPLSAAHLDGVLGAGAAVQAALADRVRADADVLLHLVGIGELRRAPVQLLLHQSQGRTLGWRDSSLVATGGTAVSPVATSEFSNQLHTFG